MRRGVGAALAAALAVASAIGPVHLRADEAGNTTATSRRLAAIRQQPLLLEAFLREMPKGGDLHNHLSGSIYAESYIRWAAEDGLCLITATFTVVAGACDPA